MFKTKTDYLEGATKTDYLEGALQRAREDAIYLKSRLDNLGDVQAKHDELQVKVQELEQQLAHAIADARISAMIHERLMQRQHEQFQAEHNSTVQQANAEFERLRARIAELEQANV